MTAVVTCFLAFLLWTGHLQRWLRACKGAATFVGLAAVVFIVAMFGLNAFVGLARLMLWR